MSTWARSNHVTIHADCIRDGFDMQTLYQSHTWLLYLSGANIASCGSTLSNDKIKQHPDQEVSFFS